MRLLLERQDVEPDSKDNHGRTPLSWAAQKRVQKSQEAIVRLLLERQEVEPDSKDNSGRTPLSWAAQKGHHAIVRLLLERQDVEPDSEDNDGHTPLWWSSRKTQNRSAEGNEAIVRLLSEAVAMRAKVIADHHT